MSVFISWEKVKNLESTCSDDLEKVISKLGGDGITLSQAKKVCKDGFFALRNAIGVATALQLPNWQLALGRMVAHTHSKAIKYYKNEDAYLHNQQALEAGRLKDIDSPATNAARAAKRAANWSFDIKKAANWAARTVEWAARVTGLNDLIDIYFDALEEE